MSRTKPEYFRGGFSSSNQQFSPVPKGRLHFGRPTRLLSLFPLLQRWITQMTGVISDFCREIAFIDRPSWCRYVYSTKKDLRRRQGFSDCSSSMRCRGLSQQFLKGCWSVAMWFCCSLLMQSITIRCLNDWIVGYCICLSGVSIFCSCSKRLICIKSKVV